MREHAKPEIAIHRAWKNGDWHADLPKQARHVAREQPTINRVYVALQIQHAVCGFDAKTLEDYTALLTTCKKNTQWSKPAIRLLCTHVQAHNSDAAHEIVARFMIGKCPHWLSYSLARFPLALQFLAKHYSGKLNGYLLKKANAANSLLNRLYNAEQLLTPRHADAQTKGHKKIRVAIVGNGGSLLDRANGEFIDEHDIIIRFNKPVLTKDLRAFTGIRTDGIVVSPNVVKSLSKDSPVRLAVSGINVLAGASGYWQQLANLPTHVLIATFAQSDWYELVQQLQAPPSAGLLTLQALSQVAHVDMSAFGFTTTHQVNSQNLQGNPEVLVADKNPQGAHYGDSYSGSGRHNWSAEAALLQQMMD